ncbi:MAG: hypothetical protein M0002_11955 [Rhodospirillales bacterium]|nr:hypothetical protein [Rhodospirillales bacterium]
MQTAAERSRSAPDITPERMRTLFRSVLRATARAAALLAREHPRVEAA